MEQILIWVIVFLLFGWVGFLTYQLISLKNNYRVFTKGEKSETLSSLLASILDSINTNKNDINQLNKNLIDLEKSSKLHIQKIGLLRFNPFRDTGGDQSFCLSLVDSFDSGIVISALYSRSGTRWYAKKVKLGKGEEFELSEEEEKAIKLAKNIKS